jgi:hypothetical protein
MGTSDIRMVIGMVVVYIGIGIAIWPIPSHLLRSSIRTPRGRYIPWFASKRIRTAIVACEDVCNSPYAISDIPAYNRSEGDLSRSRKNVKTARGGIYDYRSEGGRSSTANGPVHCKLCSKRSATRLFSPWIPKI